jgi:hypothetical protein
MSQELQNALAFYEPAPQGTYSGIEGKWLWLWETLQGDFHENPSTAQIVTGTVISMIPLVDQISDIRDLIANCRKIDREGGDTWTWVALALTLVGLFPVFGSLLKGCFKVMVFYIRRNIFKTQHSMSKMKSEIAKTIKSKAEEKIDPAVFDESIAALKRFLDKPAVRKTLSYMEVHKPFLHVAGKLDEARKSLAVNSLLEKLDELMRVTRDLFDSIVQWGPKPVRDRVEALWSLMERVRDKADEGLARALRPVQDCLDQLINRLRVEGDNAYRARVGNNTHVLGQREAAELELIGRAKPDWVDEGVKPKYPPLEDLPEDALAHIAKGWPDISKNSSHAFLGGKYNTFGGSLRAVAVSPGERLYRVVDQSSVDNSIFWMREADFSELKSKGQWRREFAVWKHWNENGEYIIYTVPSGQPLKVWEGRSGTQALTADSGFMLEGGRVQIALNPDELNPKFISPRYKTGWGYDDGTGDLELDPLKPYLGLPELTHRWEMPENK